MDTTTTNRMMVKMIWSTNYEVLSGHDETTLFCLYYNRSWLSIYCSTSYNSKHKLLLFSDSQPTPVQMMGKLQKFTQHEQAIP
jgi:hypothetical protein